MNINKEITPIKVDKKQHNILDSELIPYVSDVHSIWDKTEHSIEFYQRTQEALEFNSFDGENYIAMYKEKGQIKTLNVKR